MQLRVFEGRKRSSFIIRAASVAAIFAAVLSAQPRTVYLPMTFFGESKAIRTSACLQVSERVYAGSPSSWTTFGPEATAAEKSFEAVIAAMRSGDKSKLFQLSDPAQTANSAEFDAQAAAFFRQFDTVQIAAIPRSYFFDGLAVFFGRFESKGKTFTAPLIFTQQEDGAFRFLPRRTEQLSYVLLKDWYQAEWGPAKTATPVYCSQEEVKQVTHRIPLATGSRAVSNPAYLLLRGSALDKQSDPGVLGARVLSSVTELKAGLAQAGIEPAARLLTAEGATRVKEWFARSTVDERKTYKDAILEQEPFFYFNASPLVVVYTRNAGNAVQVMYFTPGPANRLVWTNASHVTVADQVFKRGALWSSAASARPFSEVVAK